MPVQYLPIVKIAQVYDIVPSVRELVVFIIKVPAFELVEHPPHHIDPPRVLETAPLSDYEHYSQADICHKRVYA